jgi:hypothetical protein
MRRKALALCALMLGGLLLLPSASAPAQAAGGPLVLMAIDAEDCGPGGHGPISVYESVVNDIMSKATKPGTGILVIGGGKGTEGDCVSDFWDQIRTDTGHSVTYVNGSAAIGAVNFAPFKMLAVASDENNTPDGLTQDEHNALSARKATVAAFVNAGGGLIGFSSDFSEPAPNAGPYDYLTVIGGFSLRSTSYEEILPTPDGAAIGITDALDVCCWHQTFTAFPPFLKVLATHAETGGTGFGEPAALGGAQVVVGPPQTAAARQRCPGYEDVEGRHLVGSPEDDILVPPSRAIDVICGLGGNDVLRGKFEGDILDGGRGKDILRGGNHQDTLKGGRGADRIRGRRGDDKLRGGGGVDQLWGGFGDDKLRGGGRPDFCDGGPGANTFWRC